MKKSFGLIDEKGNLTNAGALLADESPVRHSRLFCTRWNGKRDIFRRKRFIENPIKAKKSDIS